MNWILTSDFSERRKPMIRFGSLFKITQNQSKKSVTEPNDPSIR